MDLDLFDVIIIGAGASGLMAAYELSLAGKKVAVIEARPRFGGRIHTISNGNFSIPVELGAEFIHGNLKLTKNLLKKAGIDSIEVEGELWQKDAKEFTRQDDL
jgi:monoamine oxidase